MATSFLRTGVKGTIDGKTWEVLGKVEYSSQLTLDNDSWAYNEWVLKGRKGDLMYIQEDGEECYISYPVKCKDPRIPSLEAKEMNLFKNSPLYPITERAVETITGFEGNLPWEVEVGEKRHTAEYTDAKGDSYSVECAFQGSQENIYETEVFKSKSINLKDLEGQFLHGAPPSASPMISNSSGNYKNWSWVFIVIALISLFFSFSSLRSGAKLANWNLELPSIVDEGVTLGPVEFSKTGSIHDIHLSTFLPSNSSAWIGIELLDQNKEVINAHQYEPWHETGTDSEGHWTETDLDTHQYFRLETPGDYFLRIFSEHQLQQGTLMVEVWEGVVLSRYYLIAFAISIVLALFLNKKWRSMIPYLILIVFFTWLSAFLS